MKMTVQNGCFSYDTSPVLQNINLEVASGQLTTILGANGVGKTTLMKCLLGFQPWTEGATILDGKAIDDHDKAYFWKSISYVPQWKDMPLTYTVASFILMGRNGTIGFCGRPKEKDYKALDWVVDLLDLEGIRQKKMYQLSGGEKQMVLIARALVSGPQIVVLDEPELNLDLANQDKIYKTLRNLVDREGISCLVNTHHPFNALKYSDNTMLLHKNADAIYGETRTVLTKENIIRAFDLSLDYYELKDKKQLTEEELYG